jgi:hypothetical protein
MEFLNSVNTTSVVSHFHRSRLQTTCHGQKAAFLHDRQGNVRIRPVGGNRAHEILRVQTVTTLACALLHQPKLLNPSAEF